MEYAITSNYNEYQYNRVSWSWSYGSWTYNSMCNQCISPLKLWVQISFIGRCTRYNTYLLTLPLFAGVSRVRASSPAWTGSHAWETLISRTHLFLPHELPQTKKSSTIKSWSTFCDQYFWKFPIWNSHADEKRREIWMVEVFKWYPVIDLFDIFTGKLGHGD